MITKILRPSCRRIILVRMKSSSSSGGGIIDDLSSNEIVFEKRNQILSILLNRPKQLNVLNLSMAKRLRAVLDKYDNDDSVQAVVIKGAGDKAFCAGGDIMVMREATLKGEYHKASEFIKSEYELNYRIATFKKPYIALINGITMGNGLGISVPGTYRIATDMSKCAMPETAFGFFADVGASYFLSRLKDSFGLYLALTGNRITGSDVKRVGIATHYINSNKLSELENKLYQGDNWTAEKIDRFLNDTCEKVEGEYDTHKIGQIFNEATLEKIIENLERDNSDWAKKQLQLLAKMSPRSLKVTIKQMRIGSTKSLKECLEMEYQLGLRFIEAKEYFEGIRVVLVDRGDKPKWNPSSYKLVNDQMVDWYFTPLPTDDKLNLA